VRSAPYFYFYIFLFHETPAILFTSCTIHQLYYSSAVLFMRLYYYLDEESSEHRTLDHGEYGGLGPEAGQGGEDDLTPGVSELFLNLAALLERLDLPLKLLGGVDAPQVGEAEGLEKRD
jgi:hypothetical protein